MWPGIRQGYGWVHQTARILKNEAGSPGQTVRRRLGGLLGAVNRHRPATGKLAAATGHFLKVTRSYWPGLFHCYDVPGLPRTNNALEQLFGSARYHQRRANGRIHAAAATVIRGSVRVLAATASRLHPFGEYELRHPDLERWTTMRHSLDLRQEARRQHGRFRKDPAAYLATLEARLLKPTLPS